MVRIYTETVKKWAVGAGITGVSMVVFFGNGGSLTYLENIKISYVV